MYDKTIYNNELTDEEPAPSLMPISNELNSKCECFEQEKLILNRSKFIFKPEIDNNNFYNVTYGINDFEINFQKLLKKRNKYFRNINIIHSNFSNFVDYTEELLIQLKKLSKNKVRFELIMNIINKINDFNQEKSYYNLININIEYNFVFINNKDEVYIKKKYVHNNALEIMTQLSGMQNILKEIEIIIKEIKNRNININNNIMNVDSDNSDSIIKKKQIKIKKINLLKNKNKIIRFKKRIGIHKKSCQMIKELSCGNFVSCGLDGKLILYDDKLNEIDSITITDDWIYSISESLGAENEILVCCPEYIYLVTIDNNKLILKLKQIKIKDTTNYLTFPIKKNEMILLGDKSITKYIGTLKELNQEQKSSKSYIYEINNIGFTCGLKISDNIVVAVSNKIMRNGKDSLKFIKITNGNEINQKQEYHSFNTSPNSLILIEHKFNKNDKNDKNSNKSIKLLLCGCTKYLREQKNGILIVTPNQKNIKDNFYETGDFEVFCFCLLQNNNTMIDENNKKDNDYFLVGGYDSINNQGLIKLFRIIYNYNHIENMKIEFIQNISNLSMFKFPINCIIQSSKNGEIIASSWDGTVNLFTSPNPEIFLIS